MLGRRGALTLLEQQERDSVVRAAQGRVQLQRAAIVADRLVGLSGLGERDRHVLQDPGVAGTVAEPEPVRGDRGDEVALPLERQRLVEIVQALRSGGVGRRTAEEPAPESHRVGIFSMREGEAGGR